MFSHSTQNDFHNDIGSPEDADELVGQNADNTQHTVTGSCAHCVLVHLQNRLDRVWVSWEPIVQVTPRAPSPYAQNTFLCAT